MISVCFGTNLFLPNRVTVFRLKAFFCILQYVLVCAIAERNLNPKAACLKRREEEKSEEQQAGRSMVVPPHDIGQQLQLVRLVCCFIAINYFAVLSTICLYLSVDQTLCSVPPSNSRCAAVFYTKAPLQARWWAKVKITRLLSNLRQTTHECVYFWSHDKDGAICHCRKPHAARKLHVSSLPLEPELLLIEVLHCRNSEFCADRHAHRCQWNRYHAASWMVIKNETYVDHPIKKKFLLCSLCSTLRTDKSSVSAWTCSWRHRATVSSLKVCSWLMIWHKNTCRLQVLSS